MFHAAPAVLEHGGNPYDWRTLNAETGGTLSYLYPPIVLHAFQPLSRLPFPAAYATWFALKLIALILVFRLWHRHFEPLNGSWLLVLFFTFGFNAAILRDLTAGNIAIFEQLGLWTAFYMLVRHRPYAAGALIAVTAQFKLMPIVFVGLLLFTNHRQCWKPLFASLGLFAALLSLNFILMPETSALFVDSLMSANPNLDERGEINPSTLAVLRDIGETAARGGVTVSSLFITTIFLLYVGAIGAALGWLRWRFTEHLAAIDPRLVIYIGCLLYVLTMPRVKDYTYMILLIPALFILRKAGPGTVVSLLAILSVVPAGDSYVPGLGSLVPWLESYLPWLTAWIMLLYIARYVMQTRALDNAHV